MALSINASDNYLPQSVYHLLGTDSTQDQTQVSPKLVSLLAYL